MSFLISTAYAADAAATTAVNAVAATAATAAAEAPDVGETLLLNIVLVIIMVTLFYALMIAPQQRRFRKHREELNKLKKGDSVLTAAGFLGTVDRINDGDEEVVIDLGSGIKVTALRSTIQGRVDNKAV